MLTANITILKKGKAILQDEVSNLKIELAKRTGVESNLGKVEQNLMILNSENQSLTAQVSKLETNNTNLSLELASFKKLNDQKPVVEQAPIPSSMIRANKLLKARNLLILKNLQDIEAERIHAIARLSNLHQLGTEELKVLNELDLMSDLEGEEGVKDFVYEFLF